MSQPPPVPPHAAVPPPAPIQTTLPRPAGDDAAMRWILPVGRSGLAIAAGYLGLLSLLCFFVLGPLAILFALLAIRDINKSRLAGTPKGGMGRAVFGLVTGVIGTALFVAVAIHLVVRSMANEAPF